MGIRFQTRPFTVNGDQGNFIQGTAADWLVLPTVAQIKVARCRESTDYLEGDELDEFWVSTLIDDGIDVGVCDHWEAEPQRDKKEEV